MTHTNRPQDPAIITELERELQRLEINRARAIAERDRVFSTSESGDDTGHTLIIALNRLKSVEKQIEQIQNLLQQERERSVE